MAVLAKLLYSRRQLLAIFCAGVLAQRVPLQVTTALFLLALCFCHEVLESLLRRSSVALTSMLCICPACAAHAPSCGAGSRFLAGCRESMA